MACRTFLAFLLILPLTACAGGEDSPVSTGFGSASPQTTQPGGTDGATSDPTSTTDPIRPDMGVETSMTGGASMTSGPDTTATSGPDPTATSGPDTTTTSTTGPAIVCGDGMIEGMEECEGADLDGQTCMTLGFSGGTLACANCQFDKTQCTSEGCGDGTVNGGEECDCGQMGSPCSQAQLTFKTCANLVAPNNTNYHGGTLTCLSPQSCLFDKSKCQYCGDGVRNGPEACEGADLGGQTCQSLGYSGGGTLKCSATCNPDVSGCVNIVCGNGQCQPGEDSCNCPGDCPDDPNSCSSCQCGLSGGNCYCDDACVIFGDCCFDGPC